MTAFLKTHGTGNLECHFRRVDFMVGTVNKRNLEVYDRESSHNTGIHCFPNTLVDCRNIFTWHNSALDRIDKLVTLARLLRLKFKPYMAVLTTTTGLTYKLAFNLDLLGNRLTVSNLRLADIRINLEFAHQAVDNNLKVKLSHT